GNSSSLRMIRHSRRPAGGRLNHARLSRTLPLHRGAIGRSLKLLKSLATAVAIVGRVIVRRAAHVIAGIVACPIAMPWANPVPIAIAGIAAFRRIAGIVAAVDLPAATFGSAPARAGPKTKPIPGSPA